MGTCFNMGEAKMSAMIVGLLACISSLALAQDTPRQNLTGGGQVDAKVSPVGPVEVQLEPVPVPRPVHQGSLTPDAGSQVGVQLKLRRRMKSKPQPEISKSTSK